MNKEELLNLKQQLENQKETSVLEVFDEQDFKNVGTLSELKSKILDTETVLNTIEDYFELFIKHFSEQDDAIYDKIALSVSPLFYVSAEYEARLVNGQHEKVKPIDNILKLHFQFATREDDGEHVDYEIEADSTEKIFDNLPNNFIVKYDEFVNGINERGMNVKWFEKDRKNLNTDSVKDLWESVYSWPYFDIELDLKKENKKKL